LFLRLAIPNREYEIAETSLGVALKFTNAVFLPAEINWHESNFKEYV